jgi:hypothetical protein
MEVSTLFNFVMVYVKLWKISCQNLVKKTHRTTYWFLCEVESAAYDFTKSVLIDAHCMKFKPSIIVAGIISSSIEIALRLRKGQADPQAPTLAQIELCNKAWD